MRQRAVVYDSAPMGLPVPELAYGYRRFGWRSTARLIPLLVQIGKSEQRMPKLSKKAMERIAAGIKRFQPILTSAKTRDVNESDTVIIVTDVAFVLHYWPSSGKPGGASSEQLRLCRKVAKVLVEKYGADPAGVDCLAD